MNKALFLNDLKKNVAGLLTWILIISLLISLTMSVYRPFLENQSKITGFMNIIPKGALQFKGISNISDLLSVLGFYSANNVIYMMVLGSIFSIVISSNILLKEEYNKTAEYLLTRPVTRSEVFVSKYSVLLLYVFILNLTTSLVGFTTLEIVAKGPFSIKAFLILSLYTFLLNVLFGATGLFLSTLVRRPKPITTFCIGLVMIMYFLYTLSKISGSLAALGYASPFKMVDTNTINPLYKLEIWRVAYFAGLSFLLTTLAWRFYKHKDIYT